MDMQATIRKQFAAPPAEYGAIPFWQLNDAFDTAEMDRQMDLFAASGLGGFILHPRIGVTRRYEYMSRRFLDVIEYAVEGAQRRGLTVFLYDEASYPSGSAHGLVPACNPAYRSRGIRVVETCRDVDMAAFAARHLPEGSHILGVVAGRKITDTSVDYDSLRFVSSRPYSFAFSGEEDLSDPQDVIFVFIEGFTGGVIRGLHDGEDDMEPGAPLSADLLNPAAVEAFIALGYDPYYRRLSKYFGNTIRAMFTDEPKTCGKRPNGHRPWSHDFLRDFFAEGGSIIDLVGIFYDVGELTGEIRVLYERAIYHRMRRVYYAKLAKWCEERKIALTGHPEDGDDIGFQEYLGIPGQDVVWRWVAPDSPNNITGLESTQGKCSSDAARHRNRPRNLNECLGAFGADTSADDIKWVFDWLFVRGVNLISFSTLMYSRRGMRADDRPPDFGAHSPSWQIIRQYFWYVRRLSYMLSDVVNLTALAILCDFNGLSSEAARPLFEAQREFNYLELGLLEDGRCTLENGRLCAGRNAYRAVILPPGLRPSPRACTLLDEFARAGGQVVAFEGAEKLLRHPACLPSPVFGSLAPMPELRVTAFMKEGRTFVFLANNGETDIPVSALLRGAKGATRWDPFTGTVSPFETLPASEGVTLETILKRRESLLLCLEEDLL